MKEAGQTYDYLIKELIQLYNRKELSSKIDAAEKGKGNWTSIDDL